jgi:cell division protein FtsI/penicillin-binding protein 2
MPWRSGRLTWRLLFLALLMTAGALGLVGRLAYLQIARHQYYTGEAEAEHLSSQVVRPPRGAILDRNGYALATPIDAYDIFIERRAWQDPEVAGQAAETLAPIVGREPSEILSAVLSEEKGDYLLAWGVDFDVGRRIVEAAPAGVKAVSSSSRHYPEGDLASALIGFVGRDHVGLAGLEVDYDEILGGTPGHVYFERDSVGNPIPPGRRYGEEPQAGVDIRLTIDRHIQQLVEDELDRQVAGHGASGGTILVMEPKTGAILAMASRPSFRLSELDLSADVDLSLFRNRVVTDVYEPGSVMKVVTMATALDLGLVTPQSTYYDEGVAVVPGATISNWDFSVNGLTTATELLQKSLNTGAVWLSGLIGAERFDEYLQRFGFGERTHAGLGGEAYGLVRTSEDEDWSPADLATNSFGQGIAATPLQVITAVAALANGGSLMQPYVVQELAGPDGGRVFEPVVVRQVVSEATAETVVQMMNAVVEGVPHHGARVPGYRVAGKTGTTLVSISSGYALNSTIASFVGFAPVDDPRMIMLVKIDQPQDSALGGVVAAPVFSNLAPRILSYLGVEPQGTRFVQGS